jgi:hypothetical protein
MEASINTVLAIPPKGKRGRPKGAEDRLKLSLREQANQHTIAALEVLKELAQTATNESIKLTAALSLLSMASHRRPIVSPHTKVKWGA